MNKEKWMHEELEGHWKNNKNIPLPELKCDSLLTSAGSYYWCSYFGNPTMFNDGVIVIKPERGQEEIKNTIAHEWRHHIQCYYGVIETSTGQVNNKSDRIKNKFLDFIFPGRYNKRVIKFYSENWYEMDALVYANKTAPTEATLNLQKSILKGMKKC